MQSVWMRATACSKMSELLQSDKKLLDDKVDQIAGPLLDDGPEVLTGGGGGMQKRKSWTELIKR